MHLVELLVAASFFGVILSAAVGLLQQGLQAYAAGVARVETQQAARIALGRLAHDVRHAGLGAPQATFDAVAVAEPSRVVLHLDVNGDGTIAGPGETVTWRLAGSILRRDAGGGAQPIVNGVRDFTLTYLDGSGQVTADVSAIRTVVVSVTTESNATASMWQNGVATTFTTRVRLRNR